MQNSTVLLWWFLYNLFGVIAVFVVGAFMGFVASVLGLPERRYTVRSHENYSLIGAVIGITGAFVVNFFIYKWSVEQIIKSMIDIAD